MVILDDPVVSQITEKEISNIPSLKFHYCVYKNPPLFPLDLGQSSLSFPFLRNVLILFCHLGLDFTSAFLTTVLGLILKSSIDIAVFCNNMCKNTADLYKFKLPSRSKSALLWEFT